MSGLRNDSGNLCPLAWQISGCLHVQSGRHDFAALSSDRARPGGNRLGDESASVFQAEFRTLGRNHSRHDPDRMVDRQEFFLSERLEGSFLAGAISGA